MSQPTLVLSVKFKSHLSYDEAVAVMDSRVEQFRALKGLGQKYYLYEPATGEYSGIYIWDNKEDFVTFRDSELRATIGQAYQTIGQPRIEVFDIIKPLRS
jgi:hypothetical protein